MQYVYTIRLIIEAERRPLDHVVASVVRYSTATEAIAAGLDGADFEFEEVSLLLLDPEPEENL